MIQDNGWLKFKGFKVNGIDFRFGVLLLLYMCFNM